MNNKRLNYLLRNNQSYNAFNQVLLIDYLSEVIFEDEDVNNLIEKRVLNLNMERLAKTSNGLELGYLIIFRKYQLGLIQDAYQDKNVLENASKETKIPTKELIYKEKKANHLLNIKDESEFLNNYKNIYQGLNFIYKGLIDFKEIELKTNVNLKPGVKEAFNELKNMGYEIIIITARGEELDYEWMLFRSSVKRNDDMIESLNEEIASNKLSDEEKDSAMETIQDLEYQNVTNKLILGILDDNRLKEAKKNAKNKDVFK